MKWDCICTDCGLTFVEEGKSRPRTCPSCRGHHLKVTKDGGKKAAGEYERLYKEAVTISDTDGMKDLVGRVVGKVLAERPCLGAGNDKALVDIYNISVEADRVLGGGRCSMLFSILDRMDDEGMPEDLLQAAAFTFCHNDITQTVITNDCDIRRIRAVAESDLRVAVPFAEKLRTAKDPAVDDVERVCLIDRILTEVIGERIGDMTTSELDALAERWDGRQTPFQKKMAEAASLIYYMKMGHPNVTAEGIHGVFVKAVDDYIKG